MIKLKNLTIKEDVAIADIVVEDSNEIGTMEVDLSKEEVVRCVLPSGYEWCRKHIEHAKNYLVGLHNQGKTPPSEKLLMWC